MWMLPRIIAALAVISVINVHSASFSVTNTNDSGAGSLRQAMLDANATPDLDVIRFNISGAGPHTIAPLSPLPIFTNPVVMDGFTQPGAKPNELRAGNNAVFKIELNGINAGVGANGLEINNGGTNTIRGLVINRFGGIGIYVSTSGSIEGNLVGTDIAGTVAQPNGNGIWVGAGGPVHVGGTSPAARNVVSGNTGGGIGVGGGMFSFAVANIQGNFIGTDATGTVALGNGGDGISLSYGPDTVIGETQLGAGNVIAANGGNGIFTTHRTGNGSVIRGNAIGTDLTGTIALGNGHCGIAYRDSGRSLVEGNMIANNLGNGILLSANNFFYNSTFKANSIYDNGGLGLNLQPFSFGPPSTFEPTNTVTANDPGDADGGVNGLQNFPLITNVTANAGVTTIIGTLSSLTNFNFAVELFRSPNLDASGYGEGKYSLGATNLITDGSGNVAFAFTTSQSCAGQVVTATASQILPSTPYPTSEFSPGYSVPGVFAGNFQFKTVDFVATEGGSAALIEVVRLDSSAGAASVAFLTLSGSATAGSDFTSTNGTLAFANGETNKTFLVPIINDSAAETAETLSLMLTNPSTGSGLGWVSSASLTILDNDPLPNLSINDVFITEGDSGGNFAIFTISLSASNAVPVTFAYFTAAGSATAGADFAGEAGTLTFLPGETEIPLAIVVKGDVLTEASETFSVNLGSPANASIAGNQGTCTIFDNESLPQLMVGNASTTEGDSGAKQLDFLVSLSAPSGQSVTVNYFTTDNTATAGSDYQAKSGGLVFTPGQTTTNISITINGDIAYETDESFFVTLTNATAANIFNSQGIGTIVNDDPVPPSLTINNLMVAEGNSGSVFGAFSVNLSVANAQTVSVAYATSNGTAIAGIDYTAKSGVVTFPPGETLKPITVTVKGDTVAEANETFYVVLSNPTNAIIAQATGTVTIQDDDNLSLQIGRLGNQVALYWTTNSDGVGLFTSTSLVPAAVWLSVTNPVTISNGWFTVMQGATNPARFYQLRTP